MENALYWDLSEEDRKKVDLEVAEKTKPKIRFYLWDYCRSYGWRQMGYGNGYATIEGLKADSSYTFNLERGRIQKILKAEIVEEN